MATKIPNWILIAEFVVKFLPRQALPVAGYLLGTVAYYVTPKQRKRVLNNLAIASKLNTTTQQRKKIARASFQNLYIVTLDYLRLRSNKKRNSKLVVCENPEITETLQQQGQGMIIVAGHLSNWEVPFLEQSFRLKGNVVAQRFFIPSVADWIDSIRTQFGGGIIYPADAVYKGIKSLRDGLFVGLATDQALPEGNHCFDFLGARAWTTITPALWAYRTNSPIIVLNARREGWKYITHHNEPIWPNKRANFKDEINRLMALINQQIGDAICQRPEEYLWLHSRFKQHNQYMVKKPYQYDFLLIVLPDEIKRAEHVLQHLAVFSELYPRGVISIMIPNGLDQKIPLQSTEKGIMLDVISYEKMEDTLRDDWKYQLVFNFTGHSEINRHYKKRGAFSAVNIPATGDITQSLKQVLTS